MWLEGYLAKCQKCLMLVSHSQDFLNGVRTHIIWLTQGTLRYYTGNYDTYQKTVRDDEVVVKKYEKEQGHQAPEGVYRLVRYLRQCAQAGGVEAEDHRQDDRRRAHPAGGEGATSPSDSPIAPRCLRPFFFDNVSFAYDGKKEHYLYDLDFGVDCDSRIALVAPTAVSPRCSSS